MPLLNVIIAALQRVVAFFDRHRGLSVVLLAAVVLGGAGAVPALRRPPVIAPALDAVSGGLMSGLSQPLKVSRLFRRGRPAAPAAMQRELDLARLRELERENARLRAMLGYDPPAGLRPVAARVIGLDLDPLRGIAWISAGSGRGLAGGEAVMSVRGLVGVVDRVEGGRSRVRLLRNEVTPVSVRCARSRVLGIVEWDPGESRLRITKVPLHADLVPGDTLLTSGLGGVFPPGLPVGVVQSVEDPPGRLLKQAVLRAFGTFFRLEEVFVLLPVPGGMTDYGPLVPAPVPATADRVPVDTLGTFPGGAAADTADTSGAPPPRPWRPGDLPPDDEMGPWSPPPAGADSL